MERNFQCFEQRVLANIIMQGIWVCKLPIFNLETRGIWSFKSKNIGVDTSYILAGCKQSFPRYADSDSATAPWHGRREQGYSTSCRTCKWGARLMLCFHFIIRRRTSHLRCCNSVENRKAIYLFDNCRRQFSKSIRRRLIGSEWAGTVTYNVISLEEFAIFLWEESAKSS